MSDTRIYWTVYARRPSDFAVVEEEHKTEARAYDNARQYRARGFDVTVHVVAKELVAEWKDAADE